jgi:hypothetical protein
MAKKIDLQAKAKRQKIIAAVGGVVLLALLAYQVPKTLKLLHGSSASASPPPASTTPASTPGSSVAATASSGGATSDGLSDPGLAPGAQSGQLLGFSRFRSKDPFAQQVNASCTDSSGSETTCTGGSTGGTGSTGGAGPRTGPGSPPSSGAATPPQPQPPPAAATSARISVNGVAETVSVGGQFPASSPTFRLVSLTRTSAKIGIAGGSLDGAKQTVTLKLNTPVTLMNTADGTRYVLRLLSVSSAAPASPNGP